MGLSPGGIGNFGWRGGATFAPMWLGWRLGGVADSCIGATGPGQNSTGLASRGDLEHFFILVAPLALSGTKGRESN